MLREEREQAEKKRMGKGENAQNGAGLACARAAALVSRSYRPGCRPRYSLMTCWVVDLLQEVEL